MVQGSLLSHIMTYQESTKPLCVVVCNSYLQVGELFNGPLLKSATGKFLLSHSWQDWVVHNMDVLPFRRTLAGWRNEPTETS